MLHEDLPTPFPRVSNQPTIQNQHVDTFKTNQSRHTISWRPALVACIYFLHIACGNLESMAASPAAAGRFFFAAQLAILWLIDDKPCSFQTRFVPYIVGKP